MSRSFRGSRRVPIAVVVTLVIVSLTAPGVGAADPPSLRGPAPDRTREGDPKGSGRAAAPRTTGRLIVRYRDGSAARDGARSAAGVRLVGPVALPNAELVDPAGDLTTAMATLRGRSDVLSVDLEFRRTTLGGPVTEPRFAELWGLHNTGQVVGGFAGAPDVDMNVPEAWDITTGSPNIVVAVIDDGVNLAHPELRERAWMNAREVPANGVDDDANGYVDDVNGWDFCNDDATVDEPGALHGTHVAGTIAASGNGIGIAGVAPGVRIMALKFISGEPECGTDTQAIEAIEYAVAQGAQVINVSWGGAGYSAALDAAIGQASGSIFIAAAGNDNTDDLPFPASSTKDNVLTVAAIHNEGFLTAASNFSADPLGGVDIAAPGESILSSVPPDQYDYSDGTSMAAAHVSGVAALALSAHASLAASGGAAVREHLLDTGRVMPSLQGWLNTARIPDARGAVVGRPDIRRLSGADRYATSVAISRATYPPYVPYLFIATGENFPDALAGGPLAATLGAPILLVRRTELRQSVRDEIMRLKPFDIFVLGGPGTIDDSVLAALAAYDHPASGGPYRLAGADRYATAAAISRSYFEPGVVDVMIASGRNFPDALAGGPAAASSIGGAPILLVTESSIPQATRDELLRLSPGTIHVLGGTGAISQEVLLELRKYAWHGAGRHAGPDRYATAAVISRVTNSHDEPPNGTAFVASGTSFPDALAGGAPAGTYPASMLLTRQTALPTPTADELRRMGPVRIFVLGGTGVVSDAVVSQMAGLFP